jgi:hypothetical protein
MTFMIIGLLMMTGNPQPIDVIQNKAETLELCMSGVKAILELPVPPQHTVQAYCIVHIAGTNT